MTESVKPAHTLTDREKYKWGEHIKTISAAIIINNEIIERSVLKLDWKE